MLKGSKLDNHPWLRSQGKAAQGTAWQASLAAGFGFLAFSMADGAPLYLGTLGGLSLLLSVTWYERKHYYRIIKELESELEALMDAQER